MKKLLLSLALLPFSTFLARIGFGIAALSLLGKVLLFPLKLLLLPVRLVGWLAAGLWGLLTTVVLLPFQVVAALVGGLWAALTFVLMLPVRVGGGVLRLVTAPVRWALPALALLLPFGAVAPQATAQTASEVFEEVERRQKLVANEEAAIRMEIVDERGRTRTRQMRTYTKVGADDRAKSLVVFTGPADIRGMGLLTIERDGGDEQQLYLPALRRVQRISGSQRGERFAGSDFTYEDLSTRDPDEYRVALVET
ncbi:MAG: outer membrane lipoprotein-sorting protein, partial [Rhodothermales bacterium]|nr:outer membrane lipoprotein-sorting protein [Rhodothermales bacterium]